MSKSSAKKKPKLKAVPKPEEAEEETAADEAAEDEETPEEADPEEESDEAAEDDDDDEDEEDGDEDEDEDEDEEDDDLVPAASQEVYPQENTSGVPADPMTYQVAFGNLERIVRASKYTAREHEILTKSLQTVANGLNQRTEYETELTKRIEADKKRAERKAAKGKRGKKNRK